MMTLSVWRCWRQRGQLGNRGLGLFWSRSKVLEGKQGSYKIKMIPIKGLKLVACIEPIMLTGCRHRHPGDPWLQDKSSRITGRIGNCGHFQRLPWGLPCPSPPCQGLVGSQWFLPVIGWTEHWSQSLTLILLPVSRFFRLDIQNNLWKLVSAWGWGWFFFSGHFGHQVTTATQWPLTIRNYSYWLLTICPIEFNASKAIDPTLTKREHLTYLTNCEAYSPRPKKEDTRIWLLTFRPDRIYN